MTNYSPQRFDSLTGLRGILALLVVVAHGVGRVGWLETNRWTEQLFLSFGHFGVVGFFILSGFILQIVYRDRVWTIRDFAVNRFARIYPLYLFCLILAFPIDWYSPGFSPEKRTEALGLSLFLQQSWFQFSNGRFNGPGWTLGVEFFFYALFPLFFAVKKKSGTSFYIIAITITLLTALFWNPANFSFSHRVPHMRVWEFVLGILLADLYSGGVKKCNFGRNLTVCGGVALLLGIISGAYLPWVIDWAFAEWLAMAFFGLAMILFLALADGRQSDFRPLASRPLVLLGEISYAVYLVHDSIQRYGKVFLERMTSVAIEDLDPSTRVGFIVISILVSLVSSYFLWKFLEMPSRQYFRSRFKTR